MVHICKIILSCLRSSRRRCSVRKSVLRNFVKFTGKRLCQSLFFNKVASLSSATLPFLITGSKGSSRYLHHRSCLIASFSEMFLAKKNFFSRQNNTFDKLPRKFFVPSVKIDPSESNIAIYNLFL